MPSVREIMDRIAANPTGEDVGQLSNDLVHAISRTGAVGDLRPFLAGRDSALVEIATWVASELGAGCAPLLDQVVPLLEHPVREVRFYAVDCLLASHDAATGRDLAAILGRLDDTDSAVRWKVMEFLARAPASSLQRMWDHVESVAPGSADAQGLRWLASGGARDPAAIISAMEDADARLRKYAAVAAARIFSVDRSPLVHASTVEDADVRNFAASWLKLHADIDEAARRRKE